MNIQTKLVMAITDQKNMLPRQSKQKVDENELLLNNTIVDQE